MLANLKEKGREKRVLDLQIEKIDYILLLGAIMILVVFNNNTSYI